MLSDLEAVVDVAELDELSAHLWRERELLELLTFKLEVEQLVVDHGRTDHLALASREVEAVLEALREAALARAVAVGGVAIALRTSADPRLGELVAGAPSPWDVLLADHRDNLLHLVEEVRSAAEANRAALDRARYLTPVPVPALGEGAPSDAVSVQGGLREIAFEAAISGTEHALQSSLLEFLR